MENPKLVLVEWEDASVADDGTWVDKKNLPVARPVVFQQVGWLLEWTDAHLVMTEAVGEDLIAPRNRIPAGMVRGVFVFDRKTAKRLAQGAI